MATDRIAVGGTAGVPAWLTGDAALFAFAVLVLGVGIWAPTGITGQDEYLLSLRTPMEMVEHGRWWTPWLDDQPRLKKPPLLYWLSALGYATVGVELVAARIWGVLAGAGLALLTARLARRLFGGDGLVAGLLAAAAIGVAVEARRAMLDLPMAFFVVLAVTLGARWLARPALASAAGVGVALAMAAMTKGPVPLVFAIGAALGAVIAFRGRGAAAGPRPWWHAALACGVFLALALPWPLAMWLSWPQLGDVLVEQTEARSFRWIRVGSIGPVLGGALGLIAPWSVAVLHGFVTSGRRERTAAERWLLWWCLLSAVPFLFMKSFERYTIPLVCPMAIIAARLLTRCSPRVRRVHFTVVTVVLGVPTLAFCGFTLWFGLAWFWPLIGLGLFGSLVRGASSSHAVAAPDAVGRFAVQVGLLVMTLLGLVYPSVGVNALPDDLPADLTTTPTAIYRTSQPGMLSVRRGRSVTVFEDADELGAQLDAGWSGYVFTLAEHGTEVEALAAEHGRVAEPIGAFRSFYARKAWLRFARPDARWPEWRDALAEGSLRDLKPGFVYHRIR